MIRFECDYAEGMHPRILERLMETNMEQTAGYGVDPHCDRARELIKQACGREDVDVHFLVGGTQANMTVIASVLRPHQGVFCADSGHLNVHETGAIEATGHKVIILPTTQDGKLTAEGIKAGYDAHWNDETHEHIVQPGMVYISQSTEDGTTYTLAELKAISQNRQMVHCRYEASGIVKAIDASAAPMISCVAIIHLRRVENISTIGLQNGFITHGR